MRRWAGIWGGGSEGQSHKADLLTWRAMAAYQAPLAPRKSCHQAQLNTNRLGCWQQHAFPVQQIDSAHLNFCSSSKSPLNTFGALRSFCLGLLFTSAAVALDSLA